jgi:hypothetical protein
LGCCHKIGIPYLRSFKEARRVRMSLEEEVNVNVQFDWHFDDEKDMVTGPDRDTVKREKSRQPHSPYLGYSRAIEQRASASRTIYGAGLTRTQRRLHAALARVKPWLCPQAQPEQFGLYSARRRCMVREKLTGLRGRLKYHPDQIPLTRRQRRLHAALARTMPWLCPYGQPE